MGFQDAIFLTSRASFHTIVLTNYGRGECLGTATCLKTVVGVSCKIFLFQQIIFCDSQISLRSQSCHNYEVTLATISFLDITGFIAVVSV